MKKIIYWINPLCFVAFLAGLLLFSSCGSETKVADIQIQEKVIIYDEALHKEAIKEELSYLVLDSGFYYLDWMDTLSKIYQEKDFAPFWSKTSTDSIVFKTWYTFVSNAAKQQGLYAKWYGLNRIKEARKETLKKDAWNYNQLASLDIAISLCMLHIHKDHVLGRTEPKEVFGSDYQLPLRIHAGFDWISILSEKEYQNRFNTQSLKDSLYLSMADELVFYYQLKEDSIQWQKINFEDVTKLEPGMSTTLIPQIASKLIQMNLMDTTERGAVDSFKYTQSFSKIIKRVQSIYALMDDGVIGRKGMEVLNTSLDDRIAQIMANMERVRWFTESEKGQKVVVNLPDYTLKMSSEDSLNSMVVCVGKPKGDNYDIKWKKYQKTKKWFDKPKDHETPQIYSRIRYMVINPTWTVPQSIIMREMYWRMRRDSTYLRRNKYRVYRGKKELYPDTINWKKYRPNRLPFKFVQVEGESNALGKVKYIFPNPYSIYLHDTPLKSKFKINQRAVSHGCIRLAEPFEMARFLLEENPRLDYDDFRIKMGMSPLDSLRLSQYDPLDSTAKIQKVDSTEVIYLHKPVPVYFTYRTLFFNQGKPVYRYDIYGRNKKLLDAMSWVAIKHFD